MVLKKILYQELDIIFDAFLCVLIHIEINIKNANGLQMIILHSPMTKLISRMIVRI